MNKPRTFDIEELLKMPLEERVYRLRCVEAWSMVIPWIGFELKHLIKAVEPTNNAKYIQFVTIYAPEELRGQRRDILDWPYKEGLRMDEAMNPLTIMGVGLYGEVMPNQNGAPIRVVVPWKYGFKSAKSIVKIRFVEKEPPTAWNFAAPHEYGFYSNVNPTVNHPRWSQASERRIGDFLPAQDADVQRLRGAGGAPVQGDGPEETILTWPRSNRLSGSRYSSSRWPSSRRRVS